MSAVIVAPHLVSEMLRHFHEAGRRHSECVALLLGRRIGEEIVVSEVCIPDQRAGMDFFEIPPSSMEALFARLRAGRLMIAAQVHTHPMEAFHSVADDTWAIIRHEGALSLVLPYFARATTETTFLSQLASFRLSPEDTWEEIPPSLLHNYFRIQP
jgi:hypothetical protein